jgi:hypothetical protein
MKTTKKQFELFKHECQRLIERWGLHGWRVEFVHDKDDTDERASIGINLTGKAITFYFPVNWADEVKPTDEIIIKSARHEVIHLITARLRTLAIQRFTSSDEIYEANEEVARYIEKVIKKGFD